MENNTKQNQYYEFRLQINIVQSNNQPQKSQLLNYFSKVE